MRVRGASLTAVRFDGFFTLALNKGMRQMEAIWRLIQGARSRNGDGRKAHDHSLIRFRTMKRRTKPAKAARAALVLGLLLFSASGSAQGLNNLWSGGFDSDGPPPFGGIDLNFQSGSLVMSTESRAIGYRRTSSNITEGNGVLLHSTNGNFVANLLGDTMLNGNGLNPGAYAALYPEGILVPQGALILPRPESIDEYYLLHMTLDDQVGGNAEQLFLSIIDMSSDGGLGAVLSKNEVILAEDFNVGKLTAVRHANGRDWWVFCHKINTDTYCRMLLTPSGIIVVGYQAIGAVRGADAGQVCFSPDGSKFAYYWGEPGEDLDIFRFDRCTGLFYDRVYIPITDYDGGMGVAFSPNGRYVYVSSVFDVYQFDTEAADVAASMVHIAEWDSTYSPFPPLATLFDIAQLAPDGKIYIGTGNSTDKLHVIHRPDSAGRACDTEPHGIALPLLFSNSLPNHPNYHLGPVDGSVCDSLGITNGVGEFAAPTVVGVYPNPSDGEFALSYSSQPNAGLLEVFDLAGHLVLRERLPAWSTLHNMQLRKGQAGMYHCRLQWGARSTTVRVILQP